MSGRPQSRADHTSEENLAKAMARIEEVRRNKNTVLELSGFGLTELPESVAQLTHIQLLSLNENRLTDLPDLLCQLTQLQWLY